LSRHGAIVLSCEHAGHAVPRAYRYLFAAEPSVLTTHRGYDIGIAPLARKVSEILDMPVLACRTSRLLIEPNRSLHHPKLFSEFSRDLSPADKSHLVGHIWRPHRDAVTAAVAGHIRHNRRVLHLALHSFAPVLEGTIRTADVGLLYDPQRPAEQSVAVALQEALRQGTPLRIRRNYPYCGRADGLTTALRRLFGADDYLGLEIEWNQGLLTAPQAHPRSLARTFCEAVRQLWPPPVRGYR